MQTEVEPLPEDRVRLSVEVPADDVRHAVAHTMRHLAQDLRVPGFRKGKVPPHVVRARMGDEAVMAEAVREHLPSWYSRALDTARVEPIDRPEIDYDALPGAGEPFRFTATVAVPPVAELPADLRLEAVRPEAVVPEGLVEQELERLRSGAGELAPVEDGTAELGQFALIDFAGTVGGRPIKDGSASDYLVQLGSGRLVGGIEQSVIGMRPGETRQVDVTFPPDYGPKAIAGKQAVFVVTLKELKQRVLPDLDDELARNVSEFDTLEALRADIEARAREAAEAQIDGQWRTAVLRALGEAARVDVPPAMVDARIRERLSQAERSLSQRGVSFDTFLQTTGRSVDQLVGELRPEAEAEARQELALKAYADQSGVTVSDEELEDFVREETASEKDPAATAEKILTGPAAESVRDDLRLRRALDRLVEIATPLPMPVAATEEPAAASAEIPLQTPAPDADDIESGSAP
jgi:trigger factor